QDRVERRPELVRHAGQKLRLVPAGHLELPALVLDLAIQLGVLDGEDGLVGEGLEKIDDFPWEASGLSSPHDENADDLLLEEQGNGQERPIPMPLEERADADHVVRALGHHVSDLDGSTLGGRLARRAFPETERSGGEHVPEIVIEPMSTPDTAELLR